MHGEELPSVLPEQELLLPPSLRDWLPENHLAYFVSDLIDQVDLSSDRDLYTEQEERGYPPYHPRMMTKILVYGYCVGVFTSRRLRASGCRRTWPFGCWRRATSPTSVPSPTFAGSIWKRWKDCFEQVLRMALEAGGHEAGAGSDRRQQS